MASSKNSQVSEPRDTLVHRLAAGIVDHLIESRASRGDHLKAIDLAQRFEVSRFPIREALVLLEGQGILESRPYKGFFVQRVPKDSRAAPTLVPESEELFLRISRDKLVGSVPNEFTESDLARLYGVNRREIRQALERLSQEGWIRRRMGHGWRFAPMLDSPEALKQSYRLRMALEPAGLLEPTFRVDREAFASWRKTMQEVKLRHDKLSPGELLKIGSGFHEMLMGCTHNPFFVDTLKRQNRLRMMIERHVPADDDRTLAQVNEHIEMMDRLEDGDFFGASVLMRRHLDVVGVRKVKSIAGRLGGAASDKEAEAPRDEPPEAE